jgi:hypothetical protein
LAVFSPGKLARKMRKRMSEQATLANQKVISSDLVSMKKANVWKMSMMNQAGRCLLPFGTTAKKKKKRMNG